MGEEAPGEKAHKERGEQTRNPPSGAPACIRKITVYSHSIGYFYRGILH